MAPKASRGGGEASLEILIPRLGRSQLEALLLSYDSVLPKGRLKKDLLELLSPEMHKKDAHVAVARSVEGAAELVTTGPFRMLSGELTLLVFMRVPDMRKRLMLVSEVCKGWRALRKEPCLWQSVQICGEHFSSKGAVAFCDPSSAKSPLVSAEVVETLSLVGGKKIDARSIKAILKSLIHATSISLDGKKVSPDCLAQLIKRGKGAAPLRELRCSYLGSESGGKSVSSVTLDIIAAQPELAVLEIQTALTEQWVTEAGQRARIARKGGNSLLTFLKIGCVSLGWHGGLTLQGFARLGTAFPELGTLHITHLNHLGMYYRWGAAPLPTAATFSPLPRLEDLTIGDMIDDAHGFGATGVSSAAVVGAIMRCVAAAATGLLRLKVGRGYEYLSRAVAAQDYAPVGTSKRKRECSIRTLETKLLLERELNLRPSYGVRGLL